jgi:hypothetical protein
LHPPFTGAAAQPEARALLAHSPLLAGGAAAPRRSLLATRVIVTDSNYDDVATFVPTPKPPPAVQVDVSSTAANPPKGDTSFGVDGSRVGSVATAEAIGTAPSTTNQVNVRAQATATTKFAPARAIATATGQNGGGGDVFVLAQARAVGKPSLQYSTILSKSSAVGISGGATPATSGNVAVLSTSRATGGQGQTVSTAYAKGVSGKATFIGVDSRANSAKWYMAPGNAVAGGEAIGIGGHVVEATDVRARADLGTATSGVLNVAKSNGVQQTWWDLLPLEANLNNGFGNVIFSSTNNNPRTDAGAAIAGTVNIGTTPTGKVVLLNQNVESGAAVGESLAGLLNLAVSNDGDVLIGDYDNSDATQNEVIAKVRGRGEGQGGMINIGGSGVCWRVVGYCVVCCRFWPSAQRVWRSAYLELLLSSRAPTHTRPTPKPHTPQTPSRTPSIPPQTPRSGPQRQR